uniref:PH domain-containing protein n=1 Tax=Eptatretus burgeri TaxID=7764 RepID=A0A8C4N2J0_EPTBU
MSRTFHVVFGATCLPLTDKPNIQTSKNQKSNGITVGGLGAETFEGARWVVGLWNRTQGRHRGVEREERGREGEREGREGGCSVLDRSGNLRQCTRGPTTQCALPRARRSVMDKERGEDEEYMYMNSIGLLNETSLVQETRKNNEVCGGIPPGVLPRKPQLPLPEIPELPTVGLDNSPASSADDHYEEANPLNIDTVPEYICSDRRKSQTLPSNGLCGFYKDGNYMHSSIFTAQRDNDSDPQSSSYESYEEEEEDEKERRTPFQWPSPEASLGLVQGSQICAFLLRKKRFGQWAKQLCVVRGDRLLCYKNSRKKNPQLDFLLPGCTVGYLVKSGRRKSTHELRIVRPGSDAVVLSVQSHEQAEQWCKVLGVSVS